MKKVLPLLLFVLFAFTGCNSGPVVYEPTDNPHQLCEHAEKFTNQVAKKSKHYNAEDWEMAIQEFVKMGKNASELFNNLSEEEQMRFDNARMVFVGAIDATGDEALSLHMKDEYSKVLGD